MALLVKPKENTFFNSKLTPSRTKSLVFGYSNLFKQIPMDIIRIIILYFNLNKIIYCPMRRDEMDQFKFQQNDTLINSQNHKELTFIFYGPPLKYHHEPINWNIYPFYTDISTKNPINCGDEELRFFILTSNSTIQLKLDRNSIKTNDIKANDIKMMVIHVQIFCVENNFEFNKILYFELKDNRYYQSVSEDIICDLNKLEITSKVSKDCNIITIGAQIEILHILYKNYAFWSKNQYTFFRDLISKKGGFDKDIHDHHRQYFDSGCFMVNNQRFYLFNSWYRKTELFDLISYFCKEFKALNYDIRLLQETNIHISLLQRIQYDLEKVIWKRQRSEEPVSLKRKRLQNRLRLKNAQKNQRCYSTKYQYEDNKEDKHEIYGQLKHLQKYKHRNKIEKTHKLYRNNKRKYKYNRW